MEKTKKIRYNKIRFLLWLIPLIVCFVPFFSAKWYINTYGQIGCDAILFTLLSDIHGTDPGIIHGYIFEALIPGIITAILVWFILFFRCRRSLNVNIKRHKFKLFPFKNAFSRTASILICLLLLFESGRITGFYDYIKIMSKDTEIYTKEYVDPDSVNIQFPEKKRNLIYIYCESLEATLFSKEHGGARKDEIIPELYNLAKDNTNFSTTSGPGGVRSLFGATWTAGGMVAQSAGIPLKLPKDMTSHSYKKDTPFLPSLTSIHSILHNQGYYQTLVMGSNSNFAGTKNYFTQHGVDRVYDYITAQEDGIIPKGYHVWWGMEDAKLFDYAKKELSEMSQMDKPFSMTMFTIDTHFPDGYKSDLCDDKFKEQYDNVYACSSRQLCDFVKWIQQQDFYKDTTIVICGDHPTMDKKYVKRTVSDNFTRTVYNCIVNPAVTASNSKNRKVSTMDMFPTTLAAMGCKIEGNRLGFGTNLFSDEKTLPEKYSYNYVNTQLVGSSSYYSKHFEGKKDK